MKRPGLVLGALPLITAVSITTGSWSPARAQEAPAKAPQAAPPSSASTGDSGLSEKEKALLQRISALKAPRWRTFGACRYDWAGWKLMPDGVRTTSVQCGPETAATTTGAAPAASVAVHCDTLKLSLRSGDQAYATPPLTPERQAQRCSTGRLIDGHGGGAVACAMSRDDGRAWAIPLGALLGSQVGCNAAAGRGPLPW